MLRLHKTLVGSHYIVAQEYSSVWISMPEFRFYILSGPDLCALLQWQVFLD